MNMKEITQKGLATRVAAAALFAAASSITFGATSANAMLVIDSFSIGHDALANPVLGENPITVGLGGGAIAPVVGGGGPVNINHSPQVGEDIFGGSPALLPSTPSPATLYGIRRDISLSVSGATSQNSGIQVSTGFGAYIHSQDVGIVAQSRIKYDAAFFNDPNGGAVYGGALGAGTLPGAGGGLCSGPGCINVPLFGNYFGIEVLASDPPGGSATLTLELIDNTGASHAETLAIVLPQAQQVPGVLYKWDIADFSSFIDVTMVDVILLTVSGSNAVDVTLANFHIDRDVPEPATLTVVGAGLLGFGYMRRRRAKNA